MTASGNRTCCIFDAGKSSATLRSVLTRTSLWSKKLRHSKYGPYKGPYFRAHGPLRQNALTAKLCTQVPAPLQHKIKPRALIFWVHSSCSSFGSELRCPCSASGRGWFFPSYLARTKPAMQGNFAEQSTTTPAFRK